LAWCVFNHQWET